MKNTKTLESKNIMTTEEAKKIKCKDCEYSMGNNRCPLKEQKPDNSYCEYFVGQESPE